MKSFFKAFALSLIVVVTAPFSPVASAPANAAVACGSEVCVVSSSSGGYTYYYLYYPATGALVFTHRTLDTRDEQ
ncbi:MAG TPA: hypothetical protein VF471_03475 [Pseudoxanthomonas sp.]